MHFFLHNSKLAAGDVHPEAKLEDRYSYELCSEVARLAHPEIYKLPTIESLPFYGGKHGGLIAYGHGCTEGSCQDDRVHSS